MSYFSRRKGKIAWELYVFATMDGHEEVLA
jgi:hypothetical protein